MQEINIKYINRLPDDVIINHIIPYTYQTQPRSLLNDIRSFTRDYNLVESIYMTQLNEIILLNDLFKFLYINFTPSYGIENIFETVLKRHLNIQRKTDEYLITHIKVCFHRNINNNTERKIKIIWGLMSPRERTQFINKYLLEGEQGET
jgi:hypothetical protein